MRFKVIVSSASDGNFGEVSAEFTNEEQGRKLTCIFLSESLDCSLTSNKQHLVTILNS